MNDVRLLHPEPEKLTAFGLGRLSPDEAAEIERHVAGCDTCCQTLQAVQDDTFVGLVRTAETLSDSQGRPENTDADLMNHATLPPSISSESAAVSEGEAADVGRAAPSGTVAEETIAERFEPDLVGHARYEILGLLGSGGMGAVYKAQHRLMQRTVALKVIHRQFTDNPASRTAW